VAFFLAPTVVPADLLFRLFECNAFWSVYDQVRLSLKIRITEGGFIYPGPFISLSVMTGESDPESDALISIDTKNFLLPLINHRSKVRTLRLTVPLGIEP